MADSNVRMIPNRYQGSYFMMRSNSIAYLRPVNMDIVAADSQIG